MRYLEPEEIVAINKKLIKLSGEKHNIWNKNGLEAAIARSKQYEDIFKSVAALMHSLMNNHPFEAANKRTAFLAGQLILESEGYWFSMDAVKIADRVEKMVKDHWSNEKIAIWLKRRSSANKPGEINKS